MRKKGVEFSEVYDIRALRIIVDDVPMGIAGIYTRWHSPEGRVHHSFAMLTVNADAHPVMKQFHAPGEEKRMVVILDPKNYGAWLSCPVAEASRFFTMWGGPLECRVAPRPPRVPSHRRRSGRSRRPFPAAPAGVSHPSPTSPASTPSAPAPSSRRSSCARTKNAAASRSATAGLPRPDRQRWSQPLAMAACSPCVAGCGCEWLAADALRCGRRRSADLVRRAVAITDALGTRVATPDVRPAGAERQDALGFTRLRRTAGDQRRTLAPRAARAALGPLLRRASQRGLDPLGR